MPAPSRQEPHQELRHIAVHVEELPLRSYQWVLCERAQGDAWCELQRAASASSSYKDAMADGLMALQGMVADLDVGPRHAVPDFGEGLSKPEPESEPATVGPAARKKSAYFGFGPVP